MPRTSKHPMDSCLVCQGIISTPPREGKAHMITPSGGRKKAGGGGAGAAPSKSGGADFVRACAPAAVVKIRPGSIIHSSVRSPAPLSFRATQVFTIREPAALPRDFRPARASRPCGRGVDFRRRFVAALPAPDSVNRVVPACARAGARPLTTKAAPAHSFVFRR